MTVSVRASRCLEFLIALALIAAMVGRAHADEQLPKPDSEDARAHFDAGNKAFRGAQARTDPTVQRTEYEEAIKEYLAGLAIETKFHYSFYWNLGHAYRQLGEYTRADYFYTKFLDFAPARFTLHRTAAEDFRRMMRAEMDKAATLAEPTAPAPAPLHDLATPASARPQPLPVATDIAVADPWYRDRTGWILAGAGAASLGVGIWSLASASGLRDEADMEPRETRRDELRAQASTRDTIGYVAGAAGIVALGTGVVKLTINPMKRSAGTGVRVTVGPRWISVQGRF